jgi:cell division septation protein DedD
MAVGTKLAEEAQTTDTEITLGTGKLLAIFFTAAIVCALFFGLGFNLGRASAPIPDLNAGTTASTANGSSVAKPSANHVATSTPCPAGQICSDSTTPEATPPSVTPEGTDTPAATSPASSPATSASAATTPAAAPAPPVQQPAAQDAPKPISTTPTASPIPSVVVQVAAVSRREDADALTIALRKKGYPAFVVSDLPDKLYHVQVGPFDDRKAASDTRDKLSNDGYNPIIK